MALVTASLLAWSVQLQAETRVIVQFREEPLARRSDTRDAATFISSFERFRSDFSLIEPRPASAKGRGEL